jgi:hypothetical protein
MLRVAHCTHECRAASDCPAGYACADAESTRVCMAIEQPCATASDCVTNLCVGSAGAFHGCTSRCLTADDCPRRMTINVEGSGRITLPPYQCALVSGERICVPPLDGSGGDLTGSVAQGGTCGTTGTVPCRSGVCDSEPNTCVQGCSPLGGCPTGFVCRPWQDGADLYLVCRPSAVGRVALNGPCTAGAQCASGLCLGADIGVGSYCTRFCNDRLCPSGMRCVPSGTAFDGTALALCQR